MSEEPIRVEPVEGGRAEEPTVPGAPALPGAQARGATVEGAEVEEPVDGVEAAQVEEEMVDGLPVLAEVRPLQRPASATLPAVHAAAAAATGFVAGAATLALMHRRGARKLARTQRSASRRPVDFLPVVGTRTFLVDVHLIAKPSE